VWIDPALPAALRTALVLPAGYIPTGTAQGAALRLEAGGQAPVSRWVYALVAPFPTLSSGVSLQEVQSAWAGAADGKPPLLLDESTLALFSALWGAPAPGAVEVLPAGDLLDRAWKGDRAWALVPFEALDPRWKVLEVDGLSPLRKDFDPVAYPLTLPISLNGQLEGGPAPETWIPITNRDPARLTIVAMTGVTALVRATAFTMEQRGVKYPGKDVRDWLRDADITHISNEVPFARDCPYPNPVQPDMRFCSDPRYIELLEDVSADVIELTGDHFQDWGSQAMLFTLDLYRERGWGYYGGGADLQEARQPLLVEHNGNKLAFIGCNGKGGSFAQAGPNHPGAVDCAGDWMPAEITRLRQEGYLPIATFQHFEYYTYQAQPNQERDFREVARAGAVIVSGSQAHQPQAFEFAGDTLVHYGLGNLFFDQYDVSEACRQAFIDRHVFYNGRYISTELLPILFVDYARARPMAPDEAEDLLRTVFKASGW
jgi:poly-gamma-glutamate synthesis protein (capsule biosynthesis protein)